MDQGYLNNKKKSPSTRKLITPCSIMTQGTETNLSEMWMDELQTDIEGNNRT